MSDTGENDKKVATRRQGRRPDAVAFLDSKVGLRVLKPKVPGAAGKAGGWRFTPPDPLTGARLGGHLYGTRDEVRRDFQRMVTDLDAKRSTDWSSLPFRVMAEDYLADRRHRWEPSVRRGQTQKVHVLLDDTLLGTSTMGELAYSPKRLRRALDELATKPRTRIGRPFAQSSLKTYRGLLGTLFEWAKDQELMPEELSPMGRVGTPVAAEGSKLSVRTIVRNRQDADLEEDDDGDEDGRGLITKAEMPSMEQVLELGSLWSERAPGRPWWRLLSCELAATSGPRWGEQHALRPVDLVFDGDESHIRIFRKIRLGSNGKPAGFSLPKGGGSRLALMPPHLIEDLERRCDEVIRLYGPTGLLFPSPMDPTKVYVPDGFGTSMRRYAAHAGWPVDEYGLNLWTWHSLRHRACVWQIRDIGIEASQVSEGVGHSSEVFTRKRYLGTTPESRALAAQQMREKGPRR